MLLTLHPDARDGIRTQELLRDQALNLAPLTWLGYPRACIDYVHNLLKVGEGKSRLLWRAIFRHELFMFPVPQFVPLDLA